MAITDLPTNGLPEPLQLMLNELINAVSPILEWLSLVLGGLFGLYIIYFLIKLYFDRQRIKILKEVRNDVEFLKDRTLNEEELGQLRVILKQTGKVKKKVGSKIAKKPRSLAKKKNSKKSLKKKRRD